MADIHHQLRADCIYLGRFPLCHLLLMNDNHYPWFILVPDRDDIGEIHQLDAADRGQLMDESCVLGEFLMAEFNGDKLNVAALGNQVPQLHLHHIVRYQGDPAWPTPVWGKFPSIAYDDDALGQIKQKFATAGLTSFESLAKS